jgi:hypothetical protein
MGSKKRWQRYDADEPLPPMTMREYADVDRRLLLGETMTSIAYSYGVLRETLIYRMRRLGLRSSRFANRTPEGLNHREVAVIRLRREGVYHEDIACRLGYKSAKVAAVIYSNARKKLRQRGIGGTDGHFDQHH